MSESVNSSLKTAVKGTAFIFAGMALSMPLSFLTRILIVRSMPLDEYGIYTLAVTVGGVLSVLANLGLLEGAAKQISSFLGRSDSVGAREVSKAILHIGLLASLAALVLLYLFSDLMAKHIFYTPELSKPLKVIAFFIPFYVMTDLLSNIMRGYGIIQAKVFYQDIARPLYFLVLTSVVFLLGMSFMSLIYAYTASAILVFISISFYCYKKIGIKPIPTSMGHHYRDLLVFSIPLMLSSIMTMVINWSDILMLGRYVSKEHVGIYNVGFLLASFITFFSQAFSFIYLPIASEMHSRGQSEELKRTYQVLTRWIFSATLPVFFVLIFFPEMTIMFLFGEKLVSAAVPLQLLSLGFMFHILLGANDITLIAMGKTLPIMKISGFMAVLNILLNYIFIKLLNYGTTGAATASLITQISGNIATSYILYQNTGIHPFTLKYMRPVAGVIITGLIIYFMSKNLPFHLWVVPLYFLLFLGGYAFSLLITKSIDKEDIFLFEAVSRRTGFEMGPIRKILYRFAHEEYHTKQ